MTTVHAIYKDGVLYPTTTLQPDVLKKKVLRVIIDEEELSIEEKREQIKRCFESIRLSNPFKDIGDVVEWQRAERIDREILGRQ